MKGAHVDPHPKLRELQDRYKKEMEKLIAYILKGTRNRIKQLKRGEVEKILGVEMVIAAHFTRWDLLDNLQHRGRKLKELEEDIKVEEAKDYEGRFNPLLS